MLREGPWGASTAMRCSCKAAAHCARIARRPSPGGTALTPSIDFAGEAAYIPPSRAQVAELVDALASGASGLTVVEVRVFSWAPNFLTSKIR